MFALLTARGRDSPECFEDVEDERLPPLPVEEVGEDRVDATVAADTTREAGRRRDNMLKGVSSTESMIKHQVHLV